MSQDCDKHDGKVGRHLPDKPDVMFTHFFVPFDEVVYDTASQTCPYRQYFLQYSLTCFHTFVCFLEVIIPFQGGQERVCLNPLQR